MTLPETDQIRLAAIRLEVGKWKLRDPESVNWDNAFLIRLIDKLRKDKK